MLARLRFYYFLTYFLYSAILLGSVLGISHLFGAFSGESVSVWLGAAFGISFLLSVGMGLFSGTWLGRMFQHIQGAFQKVSQGDLTVRINAGSEGLFSDFYESFHRMLQGQGELIGLIRNSAEKLSYDSKDMRGVVLDFASNIQSQSAATEEVSASIEEISGVASSISSIAGENFSSMSSLVGEVEKLSSAIEKTKGQVDGTLSSFLDISERAQAGSGSLEYMTQAIDNLSKSSKEISKMIGAIADISEKINMLSLNASIEAARAGDAGRGFAVVAEEVSKLAERTASSVRSINELVKRNQEAMNVGMERIQTTTHEIRGIIGTIDRISGQMKEVREAVSSQEELRNSVLKEANFVKTKSEEIRNAVTEHNTATGEVVDSVSSISDLAANNSEKSDSLGERILGIENTSKKLGSMVELFKTPTQSGSNFNAERDPKTHELYFKSEIGYVYYVKKHALVEVVWSQHYTDEKYKEILWAALDVVKKHQVSRWMADTTDFGIVTPEGQQWVNEVWFPEANASTLRKMAVVIPASVLAELALDNKSLKAGNVEMLNVPSLEAGLKWLLSK